MTPEKIFAIKSAIAAALNPPTPAQLTPEELEEYVGDLVAKLHDGTPEIQKARALALKDAEEALVKAEADGAETVALVKFGGLTPANQINCPHCGKSIRGSKVPAKKADEPVVAPVVPVAAAPVAPTPLEIAKANYEKMVSESRAIEKLGLEGFEGEFKDAFNGFKWEDGNLADPSVAKRILG